MRRYEAFSPSSAALRRASPGLARRASVILLAVALAGFIAESVGMRADARLYPGVRVAMDPSGRSMHL
jgi:hypothetical protein